MRWFFDTKASDYPKHELTPQTQVQVGFSLCQETTGFGTQVTVDGDARLITRPAERIASVGMRGDGLSLKDVSEKLLRAS